MNINADEFGLCIYLILKRGGELVEAVKQGQLSVKKVSQSNSTPVFLPNILSNQTLCTVPLPLPDLRLTMLKTIHNQGTFT